MAIPTFKDFYKPVLEAFRDGNEHSNREVREHCIKFFSLSEEELNERLPSGSKRFHNRVAWSIKHLKGAMLIKKIEWDSYKITDRGQGVLEENLEVIDQKYLMRYDEYKRFLGKSKTDESNNFQASAEATDEIDDKTPEEIFEESYQQIRTELAGELLDKVKGNSPAFFEQLVVHLLVKMGYGGSREDAGKAIGKPHDGGIDGVIKEDKLGLDLIYLQAKRWENTVGERDIRDFVGALTVEGAGKGIFITTSLFSSSATSYAERLSKPKVVLLDGFKLADLMIEHGVGVSVETTYEIKKIDSDYFDEF